MIKIISASFKVIDQIVSQFFLKLFSEKPALMTFIFHGLFRDEKEIGLNTVDPQQGVTIDHFRQFVEYFLNHDYLFVSPEDILGGLNNNSKYVLITFDDGYYNNIQSLTVLNKYKIPAVFFISANNVKFNKCFWWDVLYRERIRLGVLSKDIVREREWLTSKTNKEIEKYLMNLFGENAFEPRSDIDRPFTPSELKNFSKEEYVFLGNHTCDHAVLTNYSPCGINSQIIDAQNTIYDMT